MDIFSKVGLELRSITWGSRKIPEKYFTKLCTLKLSAKSQSVMVIECKKIIHDKVLNLYEFHNKVKNQTNNQWID